MTDHVPCRVRYDTNKYEHEQDRLTEADASQRESREAQAEQWAFDILEHAEWDMEDFDAAMESRKDKMLAELRAGVKLGMLKEARAGLFAYFRDKRLEDMS